jgi:hypothetical protein
MRGWLSVFTRENDLKRYRTGVLIASAEPILIKRVLKDLDLNFAKVALTYVAPFSYAELFRGRREPIWIEDLKVNPRRSLANLRDRNFDLLFLVLPGRPTFRKVKFGSLFLRPKRLIVYTEEADWFPADRTHWKALIRHAGQRLKKYYPRSLLFFPFGITYLVARTFWLSRHQSKDTPVLPDN